MKPFDVRIGATIHCRDGSTGVLHRVVLDPYTHQVADLVVERGLLRRRDRVVPVSVVEDATADHVYLTIDSQQLSQYPEYSEVEYELPAPGWTLGSRHRREQIHEWSAYGIDTNYPLVPRIHCRVPRGIPSDLAVIGRKTPVRNKQGMVGRIDHLWVDQENWEITHLIVHRGILPHDLVIPMAWVEFVDNEGVFIQGNNEQLKALPRHQARSTADMLIELQAQFEAAHFDDSDLTATLEDGILRLQGMVENEVARQQAEEIGRSISGVLKVENLLDTNTAFVARVTGALQTDPHIWAVAIEVSHERGTITLSGDVDSAAVRKTAEEIAARQPGVIAVVNALVVHPTQEPVA